MPKLSIIIPSFNSAATIKRALDSVVCQTFPDWEVLVMDGASKDDTVSIVQSYNDKRIEVCSEPDQGIYDAMNKGIAKAHGEWLYFLGSDDYLISPTTIQQVALKFDSADVVYGDVESLALSNEWKGAWDLSNIEYNRCHQAIFYHKKVFSLFGGYPVRYQLAADHYINIRCLLSSKITMLYIPMEIARFFEGGFSSRYHDALFDSDRDWLIALHGVRKLSGKQLRHHCRAALSYHPALGRKLVLYSLISLSVFK